MGQNAIFFLYFQFSFYEKGHNCCKCFMKKLDLHTIYPKNEQNMKRTFLLLLAVLPGLSWAKPFFEQGKKYRFLCAFWQQGSVVDGPAIGQSTPVYYDIHDENSEAGYWYVTETSNGQFTILSVTSQKYLTYDGERTDTKRYVDLTAEPNGNASLWTFDLEGDYYIIRNVQDKSQVLDARKDSYIVGTYQQYATAGDNERFKALDEDGKPVFDLDEDGQYDITQLVDSIVINGKRAVFDAGENCYLQTVSEKFREQTDYEVTCSAYPKDAENMEVRVGDQPLSGTFRFENYQNGTHFPVTVYNRQTGETVAQAELTFTFLPVVEFTGAGFNKVEYVPGTIRVTDPDTEGADPLYQAKFRYRGATASGMNKKAYAVKITDEAGESLDASFFGLREDNNWILDAMAVDPGRMRNRVSTDLWNDFSMPPYHFAEEPEAHNGTRGRFVETFLNGKYNGLYCMTEKLDRKQLKLKKIKESTVAGEPATIRGALYKSDQWSYSVFMGHDQNSRYYPMTPVSSYNNNSDTWDSWEMQYPDLGDGEPIDWGPLSKGINVVAAASKQTFLAQVGEQFDLPVFLDYYLFIELMLATDNHGKNMFLHHYNVQDSKMMSMSPWDLDGTWGRRWDGSDFTRNYATTDFITYLWAHEHGEHTLYKRLMEYDYDNWNEQLAGRYAALRATYFDEESLYQRFEKYVRLFQASGADDREMDCWNGSNGIYLDFDSELEYLKDWIHRRIAYLDRRYHYDPTTTGITQPDETEQVAVTGGDGYILIRSNEAQTVPVYNISGVRIQNASVRAGVNRIPVSVPGIYLVQGQKVVVR